MIDRRSVLRGLLAAGTLPLASLAGCTRPPAADFVIVGSGPAGLALADRLSAAGREVLVLEAGERTGTPDHDAFAVESHDTPLPYDLRAATLRRPGGGSRLWEGQAPRPLPAELADWPLAAGELDPWLLAAEQWLQVRPAQQQPGTAENPFMQSGAPLQQRLLQGGFRDLQPAAYSRRDADMPSPLHLLEHGVVDGIAARPRVQLLTGTQVARLEFRDRRVVALHCLDSHGNRHRIRAGQVVLCAGGIQTVRLLWNSAEAGRAPGNDEDQLGACFMEHPVQLALGRLAEPCLPGAARETRLHIRDAVPRGADHEGTLLSVAVQRGRDGREYFSVEAIFEQAPDPANRLLGGGTTDHRGIPRPRLRYALGARDRATLAAGQAMLGRLLALLGPVDHRPALRPGSHHLLGGACMAAQGAPGVVDPDLRVRGTANLYLAGSAVFPTGLTVPPTLVAVALAHRLGAALAAAS